MELFIALETYSAENIELFITLETYSAENIELFITMESYSALFYQRLKKKEFFVADTWNGFLNNLKKRGCWSGLSISFYNQFWVFSLLSIT